MRYRLDALFFTFLAIFATTAIVTLLGVTKVIPIEQENLRWLLGAFLIELAGAVVALFRSAPFFPKDELAKNLDPARDDIESMKKAIAEIEKKLALPASFSPSVSRLDSPEQRQEAALCMREALASPEYTYRSVERLAAIAGIPPSDATELLKAEKEVVLTTDKAGRQIARLASR